MPIMTKREKELHDRASGALVFPNRTGVALTFGAFADGDIVTVNVGSAIGVYQFVDGGSVSSDSDAAFAVSGGVLVRIDTAAPKYALSDIQSFASGGNANGQIYYSTDNNKLYFVSNNTATELADAGGTSLAGLSDTTIASPSNGQVLSYDGTDWKNADATGGASTLSDLTDTTIASPSNKQVLTYDGSKWKNEALPSEQLALDGLSDVTIASLASGNVLEYDGSNWVNKAPSSVDAINESALSIFSGYVDAKYTGNSQTGSATQPYTDLQSAIDNALDGDTISVNGDANREIIITTTITLDPTKGINFVATEPVTVKFASYDNSNGIIFHQPSSGSTKTYTFTNINFENSGDYALYIRSSLQVGLKDCLFQFNGWNGTGLNTVVSSSVSGVLGYDSTQAEMQAFYASSNVGGGGAMRIRDTAQVTLIDNIVRNNLRGMRIQDCGVGGFGYVSRNQVYSNLESGIYLASGSYDFTKGCENFIVYNNSCHYNANNGILSIGGYNNTVSLNSIRGNFNAGMQLWSPNNIICRELSIIDNNRSPLNGIGNLGDSWGSIHIDGTGQRAGSTFLVDILGCEVKNTGLGRAVTANGLIITSGLDALTDRSRAIINIDNVGFLDQDYAIKSECDLSKVKLTLGDMRYIGTKIQDKSITGAGYFYELPFANHHTNMLGNVSFNLTPDKSTVQIKEVTALGVVADVIQSYPINELEALGDGTDIKIILKDTRKIQLDGIKLANCYIDGSIINSIQSQALIALNSLFVNSTPFDTGGSGGGLADLQFNDSTGVVTTVNPDGSTNSINITTLNVSTDAQVVSGVQSGNNIILSLNDGSTVTIDATDLVNQNVESVDYGNLLYFVTANGNGNSAGDQVSAPKIYNTFKDNMPIILGSLLKRNQEFIFTRGSGGTTTFGIPINPAVGNKEIIETQGDSFWRVSWTMGALGSGLPTIVRTTDDSINYYSSGNDIDTRFPSGYDLTNRITSIALGTDGKLRLFDITGGGRILIGESTDTFGTEVNLSYSGSNQAPIFYGIIRDVSWNITNEFRDQGDVADGLLDRNAVTHRVLLKQGKKVDFNLPFGNKPCYFGFGFQEQSTPVGSPNLAQFWDVGNLQWSNIEALSNSAGSGNFTFNTSNSKYNSTDLRWDSGNTTGDTLLYADYKNDNKVYLYEKSSDELIGSWDQATTGEDINFTLALFNGYPAYSYGDFPTLLFSQIPEIYSTTPFNKAYVISTTSGYAYRVQNAEANNPLFKSDMATAGRAWTLGITFKPSEQGYFFSQGSGARATENGLRFFRFTNGNFFMFIGASNVGELAMGYAGILLANEWSRLIVTYDGSALNSGDLATNSGAYKIYKYNPTANTIAELTPFSLTSNTSPDITGGVEGIMTLGTDYNANANGYGNLAGSYANLSIVNQEITATADLISFITDPIQYCATNSITDATQNKIYLLGDQSQDNIAEFRNYLDANNEDDELQTISATTNSIQNVDINE